VTGTTALRRRQSFQPLTVQYQPSLLFQMLMVRYRLLFQLSFQPLRVQYQPLLLCQLLWLRRRQSFQSLRVQYQPSLLSLSDWNDCRLRSHNSWHSSNGWYWTLSG
jgi:hypothetical protein